MQQQLWLVVLGTLVLGVGPWWRPVAGRASVLVPPTQQPAAVDTTAHTRPLATLQVPFIRNAGQVDSQVAFYAPTGGGTVFVTQGGEVVYTLPQGRGDTNAPGAGRAGVDA